MVAVRISDGDAFSAKSVLLLADYQPLQGVCSLIALSCNSS